MMYVMSTCYWFNTSRLPTSKQSLFWMFPQLSICLNWYNDKKSRTNWSESLYWNVQGQNHLWNWNWNKNYQYINQILNSKITFWTQLVNWYLRVENLLSTCWEFHNSFTLWQKHLSKIDLIKHCIITIHHQQSKHFLPSRTFLRKLDMPSLRRETDTWLIVTCWI